MLNICIRFEFISLSASTKIRHDRKVYDNHPSHSMIPYPIDISSHISNSHLIHVSSHVSLHRVADLVRILKGECYHKFWSPCFCLAVSFSLLSFFTCINVQSALNTQTFVCTRKVRAHTNTHTHASFHQHLMRHSDSGGIAKPVLMLKFVCSEAVCSLYLSVDQVS
jgi:hypothetical protein